MKVAAIVVLGMAALTGCATQSREERMLQGQPPAYADGFRPGCNSGYAAAGNPYYRTTKDVQRMLDDKLYAMGWNDGFAHCKGNYESVQRMFR